MEEFIAACLGGDLDAVKAAAPARLTAGRLRGALRVVCGRGRLDVVEWFVAHFGVSESHVTAHDCRDTLARLCEAGAAFAEERARTAQRLIDQFNLHYREDTLAELCEASEAGAASAEERVRTAQWLTDRFRLTEILCTRAKRSLLVRACKHGQTETVRWLVRVFELGRADVVARRCDAFVSACDSENLDLVRWLAEEFGLTTANARARRYGHTAFTLAIARGNVEVARWLFDKFGLSAVDVQIGGVGWDTPLRIASWRGHIGVVRWIVDEVGVPIGEARLMFRQAHRNYCKSGDVECLEVGKFLVAQFDFTVRDLPGNWTPERFAAEYGPVAPNG
jgi:ankyrin repeat protein